MATLHGPEQEPVAGNLESTMAVVDSSHPNGSAVATSQLLTESRPAGESTLLSPIDVTPVEPTSLSEPNAADSIGLDWSEQQPAHSSDLQERQSSSIHEPQPFLITHVSSTATSDDLASSTDHQESLTKEWIPDYAGLPQDSTAGTDISDSLGERSSPACPPSPSISSLSSVDVAGGLIEHDYDGTGGHKILRLKPTLEQWDDFPSILSFAKTLGADNDGCFKVTLPYTWQEDALPDKSTQKMPANAYKVKMLKKNSFWQVSTLPSEGIFQPSPPGSECRHSVETAIKSLKRIFNKHKDRQLRNIRYRVDVPAWTTKQRREAGVPEQSPIYPLRGDKLDNTRAIIPGIHTPYVYESGPHFGATFQIHAEDFRLASLNHLYKGRKIWIVIPATAVDVAEQALGRGNKCSQFMRHRAEFFFPDKLDKLGIPYRIIDQRSGETIVILPDAYHEGFSTGYTIAEAKNYADPEWGTDTYQPCEATCQLTTAIPAEFMRPLKEGEERLDLCAAYEVEPNQQQPPLEAGLPTEAAAEERASAPTGSPSPISISKRNHDDEIEMDITEEPIMKRVKAF